MSYDDDRRELLKLKQGIIEEEDSSIREDRRKPEKQKLRGKAWLDNFFYHYKLQLIVGAFFLAVITFLTYDALSKEKMDIRVLLVSKDSMVSSNLLYKTADIELALETYCPDFDQNGNVHVDTYYIDISSNTMSDFLLANKTKLYSEMSLGYAQIIIGDMSVFQELMSDDKAEDCFINLAELYPDDANVVENCFYKVKASDFADTAKYVESCPEDLFIAIKGNYEGFTSENKDEKMYFDRSLEVLKNIIQNLKLTQG